MTTAVCVMGWVIAAAAIARLVTLSKMSYRTDERVCIVLSTIITVLAIMNLADGRPLVGIGWLVVAAVMAANAALAVRLQ